MLCGLQGPLDTGYLVSLQSQLSVAAWVVLLHICSSNLPNLILQANTRLNLAG